MNAQELAERTQEQSQVAHRLGEVLGTIASTLRRIIAGEVEADQVMDTVVLMGQLMNEARLSSDDLRALVDELSLLTGYAKREDG